MKLLDAHAAARVAVAANPSRPATATMHDAPGVRLVNSHRAAFPALKRRQEWKKGHIMKQNQRRKLWKRRSC